MSSLQIVGDVSLGICWLTEMSHRRTFCDVICFYPLQPGSLFVSSNKEVIFVFPEIFKC